MKVIYCLMIFFCPLVNRGQTIKDLTVGDYVPDITLTNLYNYSSSSIKLSDIKDKLVILDFWATWCSGCVQELPKLDSLQKEFANKMQILLISQEGSKTKDEDETRIKDFFRKWKEKDNIRIALPSTLQINDTLVKLFPHMFIPHYVWITRNRKVIAITSPEEINRKNIRAILNGSATKMPLKSDRFPSHPQN